MSEGLAQRRVQIVLLNWLKLECKHVVPRDNPNIYAGDLVSCRTCAAIASSQPASHPEEIQP